MREVGLGERWESEEVEDVKNWKKLVKIMVGGHRGGKVEEIDGVRKSSGTESEGQT